MDSEVIGQNILLKWQLINFSMNDVSIESGILECIVNDHCQFLMEILSKLDGSVNM